MEIICLTEGELDINISGSNLAHAKLLNLFQWRPIA